MKKGRRGGRKLVQEEMVRESEGTKGKWDTRETETKEDEK